MGWNELKKCDEAKIEGGKGKMLPHTHPVLKITCNIEGATSIA